MENSHHQESLINSSEDYLMASSSTEIGRDSSSLSSLVYGSRQLLPYPSSSYYSYCSERSSNPLSGECSPCNMSPWHHSIPAALISGASCADCSSWSMSSIPSAAPQATTCLIGSLIREEGHIYSLAAAGPLLYTGSDSKNIRVWRNQKEYAAFKSSSGLVKAIIITNGDRILTGHQDGKIRVWRISQRDPTSYKRMGTLPRLKDLIKCSLKPSNYAEVGRHRRALWIRHCDAVSCLSFSVEQGLLYSGSWDRTFKVWRIADSKCLESVLAHDDAINSVVAASFDDIVFTGSADGSVKVWRRELQGKGSKHKLVRTLLRQNSAITALVISPTAPVMYSSSSDGLINFWERDRELFSHGGVLCGHKLAVLCLAAAGRLVVSGSADKSIFVWRREGAGVHSCLSVLTGHSGPVKCLTIEEEDNRGQDVTSVGVGVGVGRLELEYSASSPQGYSSAATFLVYSGSLDKSVKVWRVSEPPPESFLLDPLPHNFPLHPN